MSQPPALPPGFDPRWKHQAGIAVLEAGLPALPEVLDYQMSIPVASWAAGSCAVVLFLQFSRDDGGTVSPAVMMMRYTRDDDGWSPHHNVVGVGWSHDP
jgi:hypothetical protein